MKRVDSTEAIVECKEGGVHWTGRRWSLVAIERQLHLVGPVTGKRTIVVNLFTKLHVDFPQ